MRGYFIPKDYAEKLQSKDQIVKIIFLQFNKQISIINKLSIN